MPTLSALVSGWRPRPQTQCLLQRPPDKPREASPPVGVPSRRSRERGQAPASPVWVGAWVALLLLAGCSRSVPPAQPAQITPITLTPGSATPAPLTGADWPMYHANPARTGDVADAPDPRSLSTLWNQSLDGAVYAEPLVINGMVIVATENDTLYALDARTGQARWHTTVGTPVPLSDLPCGNIDPLGITGTPVYDPQTGLVFAVAEITGPAHLLVGLDAATGQIKVRRLVDPPGSDPQVEQQRAALALWGNSVYVALGARGDDQTVIVATVTDG